MCCILSLPLHRELLIVLVIFPLKEKASKKQKRCKLMTERLLSNSTTSRFKFIMTFTCGKAAGFRRRNGTIILPSEKSRTVENMLL